MITVSMKDALKTRPTKSGGHATSKEPDARTPYVAPVVTCSPFWSPEEFRTYRYLTDIVYGPQGMADPRTRADAAVFLKRFVEKQGKEKCDMMLAELRRLDAAAWFNTKKRESAR